MNRAANRKNGTTPSKAELKRRRPERAGSAPRAVGADGLTVTVAPSALRRYCVADQGAGGGVLSGPRPVTDAHAPLISVFEAVSCSTVGNTVPETSGSLALRSPA